MANLDLWKLVEQTDPEHTSGFNRTGGFKGTAIKPMYLIRKATETFGPIGHAWGARSVREIVEQNMVFVLAEVWYTWDEQEHRVQHWGGDVLIKQQKSGDKPNDEAFKMAFTDAVGKCLSQIGFGADVHMGLFDDSKYIESIRTAKTAKAKKEIFSEIKAALVESDDPAETWAEYKAQINEFKAQDQQFYDDLLQTAKVRKEQLATTTLDQQMDNAINGEA